MIINVVAYILPICWYRRDASINGLYEMTI